MADAEIILTNVGGSNAGKVFWFRGVGGFRISKAQNADREPIIGNDAANALLFRFDGQLYFGNKDYFKSSLLQTIEERGQTVNKLILNVEPMNYIDSSAAFMLRQLVEDLNSRNIKVAIAGPIGPIRDSLRRSGIVDLLGEDAFYENTHSAYLSAKEDQEAEAMSKKIALESQSEYM
jgi:SulP family sulfate permease